MAGNESDREDLLREAVALVPRAELHVYGLPELLTAGYRSSGMLSLYFGQDPVYQFDTAGRLRRAFENGLLYRTAAPTLARLRRVRSENEVALLRYDLNPHELADFRSRMHTLLTTLQRSLQEDTATVIRCVPSGQNWKLLLLESLAKIQNADPWLASAIVIR
jgi:hypothetical protein